MRAVLRPIILLGLAVTALAATSSASTAASPDLQNSFPEIRRQLASSDFPQREAGQKLLDALPPSELDALRTLAKAETDPEVKARLDNRINVLELYVLTHPPGISLHVQNATLTDVCAKIAEQLGDDVQFQSGAPPTSRAGTQTLTLQADNLPFWDVIFQLRRQIPLTISTGIATSAAGSRNAVRLTPATATTPDYRLVDSFLITPRIAGNPATAIWSLGLTFSADPRVRIAQYSPQFRVAKITDQNDASLIPSIVDSSSTTMSSLARPASTWSTSVALSAAPGLKSIKELRAAVDIAILEKETTLTIDLTKPPAPIETSRGTLTINKDAAGNLVIRFATPAALNAPGMGPAPAVSTSPPPRNTSIRVFDQDGKTIANTLTPASTQIILNMNLNAANGPPAKVELSWPESTRPMTLPLELHDIPLPAPPPTPVPVRP